MADLAVDVSCAFSASEPVNFGNIFYSLLYVQFIIYQLPFAAVLP